MTSSIHILRFFRNAEARLRELAQQDSSDITSNLRQLADEVAIHATELKRELIAKRLIS
jgi:hypothetical protein